MTQKQLIEEIRQLPLEERVELLEIISRSVREEMRPREQRESAVSRLRGIAKPDGSQPSDEEIKSVNNKGSGQSEAQSLGENKGLLSQSLYGILEFDGDPPTDEELKDGYADYLMEKYS
jgi:hypothetical protein